MTEFEHKVIPMDIQLVGQGLLSSTTDKSWFKKYVFGYLAESTFISEASVTSISDLDLRIVRGAIASMLIEACDKESFFADNGGLNPIPTEDDRLATIEFVSHAATYYGFLTSTEVYDIRRLNIISLSEVRSFPKVELRNENHLRHKIRDWKNEGYSIGECQFSADPPNPTHLYMLTHSYLWAKEHGINMKLCVGMDSDSFLKTRKATSVDPRPRMPIARRREILESFWMVNGSYSINPPQEDWKNKDWWANGYRDRGVDFVFLVDNQEEMDNRIKRIEVGGAKPITIPRLNLRISSTDAANAARHI